MRLLSYSTAPDLIPNHVLHKSIYKNLYNSIDDIDGMNQLKQSINDKISDNDLNEVSKITPELVKKAILHLKPDKSDPIFKYSTDCFINAPADLFNHLSNIFKICLTHGHISIFLLLSTLVPIIKDKLGDKCASSNYR